MISFFAQTILLVFPQVEERFAERRNHVMRECQARPDHYYVGKVKKVGGCLLK